MAGTSPAMTIEEMIMAQNNQKIGWIGMGRMGFSMAERLVKAGYDLSVWNRTKSKAEPLAKSGAKIVDKLSDLAGVDVLFSIVSAGPDLDEVYFGKSGVVTTGAQMKSLPRSLRRARTATDSSTAMVEQSTKIFGSLLPPVVTTPDLPK
jgi:3-hydroxyisobutyrate dehydrogenase-like beta-hydroxyacid dehydrogenase